MNINISSHMKLMTSIFLLVFIFVGIGAVKADTTLVNTNKLQIEKPLYKPFIERYILDDLKQIRQEHYLLKTELIEKMTASKLDSADRAIRYTADTTNNIFYIITAAASIFVLFGWRSIKEVRDNIELVTEKKVEALTQKYEKRLDALEATIKKRSDQIVTAQKEIADTNLIHSLWMRFHT